MASETRDNTPLSDKERRLADALRRNLRRRKVASREAPALEPDQLTPHIPPYAS